MVYINPDTCVNCDACVPACPIEAIFSEESLPEKYKNYIQLNIDGAKNYPVINEKLDALPSAKTLEELKKLDAQGYKPPNFP
jgi:ferredoxin